MTLRQFLKKITPDEWRLVAAVAVLAVVISCIPPLYGLYLSYIRGSVWNGRVFLSAGDFNVYLSFIEQVKQGRWLFTNLFTTEKMAPTLNVFWLGTGLVADVLRLPPLLAFHLVRVLLIPPLVVMAYALIAYFFADLRSRVSALFLFVFGSGVGIYLAPLFPIDRTGPRYEWPVDMWVAESNTFLSMIYSPHFVASLLLMLLVFFLLLLAFESGRWRYGLGAGLAALVLFQFHPFHVPTLYGVPAVWLAWRQLKRRATRRQWLVYAVFVAVSLPAAAYHLYWTQADTAAAALVQANLTLTPSIWHLLIGFGPISLLCFWGYRLGRSDDDGRWDFLLAWTLTQGLLLYFPVPFQRRMIEGLEFPLAVLSWPAIYWLYRKFWSSIKAGVFFRVSASLAVATVVFLPSTYAAVYRSLDTYTYDPPPHFFHSREQAAAMEWLRRSVPDDAVVLASLEMGNAIPGWSGRRVYAGHWVYTVDLVRKSGEILRFYGTMTDVERRQFLSEQGIDYIYCGPVERALGTCPAASSGLVPVFRSGGTVILRVADGA